MGCVGSLPKKKKYLASFPSEEQSTSVATSAPPVPPDDASNCGSEGSGPAPPSPSEVLFNALQEPADLFKQGKHDFCFCSALSSGCSPPSSAKTYEQKEMHCSNVPANCDVCAFLAERGVGMACRKGKSSHVPNQDSVFFSQVSQISVFGVADGYGDCGEWVAHWTAQYALALLLPMAENCASGGLLPGFQWELEVKRIFNIVNDALSRQAEACNKDLCLSGSQLSVCMLDRSTQQVLIAWVGGSMCVRSHDDGAKIEVLTTVAEDDSRSTSLATSSRHVKPDAALLDCRLARNPAIDRRLGAVDLHEHGGSHIPCSSSCTLNLDDHKHFIMCASAGLWDSVDKEEVIGLLARAGSAAKGSETLAKKVSSEWSDDDDEETDDVSFFVIWL